MLAVLVATGLSSILSRDTIYTLKLRRRGIDLTASPPRSRMMTSRVHEAMRRPPTPVAADTHLWLLAERFADDAESDALPVVDGAVRCVSRSRAAMSNAPSPKTTTRRRPWRSRSPRRAPPRRSTLEHALECLAAAGQSLPVLDDRDALVGWIGDRDVSRMYARHPPANDARPATATAETRS